MNASLSPDLATVDALLAELRAGRPVIMVDDANRENEGDMIIPAEKVTAELIAFTIRYTGGVICLAMPNELADRLELPPMVEHNSAPRQTAYTVSIEARHGVGSGISAVASTLVCTPIVVSAKRRRYRRAMSISRPATSTK